MPIKDVLKVSRKTFFNPRGWFGYDALKENTLGLWVVLKDLFTVDQPTRQETFEEAIKRLKLTEEDLKNSAQSYTILTTIFVILGSISFLFCFYFLFYHQTLAGCVLAIATAAIFFSQAFRYHFWLFQIKHRKLGCTFEEWRRGKPYDRGETKS